MSLKTRGLLVLAIGTAMGLALSLGGTLLAERKAEPLVYGLSPAQLQQLAEVMQRVKQDYVEPVDSDALLESAIRGMVSGLDPHSQFLDAGEYLDIRISASGSYTGVGLEVGLRNGAVSVLAPIANSPGERAGVAAGDIIIGIDGKSLDAGDIGSAVQRLRGNPGSTVNIEVVRENQQKPLEFALTREHIVVASVASELLEPGLAYVRISQFNDATVSQLEKAINGFEVNSEAPVTGLILDLRNNPGGVLEAAVATSDLFLDSGVIVSGDGRTEEARFSHDAQAGDILRGAPVVVLVNHESASASEIVAGALQDNHRATVLGTQTFGKGVVQTVMPLSKGRAIKLTTSRYFTPSGKTINEIGITPDVIVDDSDDHPHVGMAAKADPDTDPQLRQAVRQLQGRRLVQSSKE
jgi:carboxyl-terminal processing protease